MIYSKINLLSLSAVLLLACNIFLFLRLSSSRFQVVICPGPSSPPIPSQNIKYPLSNISQAQHSPTIMNQKPKLRENNPKLRESALIEV